MSGFVIEPENPDEHRQSALIVRHPGGRYTTDDPNGDVEPLKPASGSGVHEAADPARATDEGEQVRGATRAAKDYVIALDSAGRSIVSATVWKRLQEAQAVDSNPRFNLVSEIPDPPTGYAGPGGDNATTTLPVRKQIDGALRDIAPPGVKVTFARSDGRTIRPLTAEEHEAERARAKAIDLTRQARGS